MEQEIRDLRNRLTRLSEASLRITESLGLDRRAAGRAGQRPVAHGRQLRGLRPAG